MDALGGSTWLWLGFSIFIVAMLSLDLGLFNRKAHSIKYREAWIWSGVWVTLALIFAGLVFYYQGSQRGLEFLTGYLIELSLSVDNLFVFLLIFSYFKVPAKYQHRVLFWGVMGALVMRVIMILIGSELIERFHWVIYIFGAFLVYTGVKMFRSEDADIEPENRGIVKLVTRFVPIVRHYERSKFFTVVNGKRVGTLLLLVLIVVEFTDLVFALDSIPAICGVTTDRFIVYTSNVFAILGLRTFYFLLKGVIDRFHYLKLGLATVLSLIGVKMLLPLGAQLAAKGLSAMGFHELAGPVSKFHGIPTIWALGVVALVLGSSLVASLIWPKDSEPLPKSTEDELKDLGIKEEDDDDSSKL